MPPPSSTLQQSKPLLGCVSFRLLQRSQPAEITAPPTMTIPDEFITSPAQRACTDASPALPSFAVYVCVSVCVCTVPAADAYTTVRLVHTDKHQRERFFSGGRHIEASQAHCIALHPTSRGCGGRPALCPVPTATGCNHKCCECNIAEARASTKTYNMATPRVEASHSLSRSERHGGEDASSSAPHCSLKAASHLTFFP